MSMNTSMTMSRGSTQMMSKGSSMMMSSAQMDAMMNDVANNPAKISEGLSTQSTPEVIRQPKINLELVPVVNNNSASFDTYNFSGETRKVTAMQLQTGTTFDFRG